MHVISLRKLKEFWLKHPDSESQLRAWYKAAQEARWQNLEQVKQRLNTAEAAGNLTVFNIRGNNYRLIVSIDYPKQVIYIKHVLTHAEYDKDKWKNDPYY